MFCTTHGGGKRCQYPEGCDKSARGSTMVCLARGGGSDVNISRVVTRVLVVRLCFAQHTEAIVVNIPRVVTRV
jgi:hypothetical protein